MAPSATAPELETAARLRRAIARLYRRLRLTDAGSAAGLAPARVSALLNVDRNGPVRLSELAAAEGLNPTMLSRMVGEMVELGLLERAADAEDRRVAWVGATKDGRALARRLRRERTAAVEAALGAMPAAERRRVLDALPALERLADALGERR